MVVVAVPGLGRLLWGRGISALGDGMWFTIWAIYFTRERGLSGATVGLAMALAAACGLAAAVPLGALADRRGPRGVLVAITVVRAAAMAGYLLGGGLLPFLVATVGFVALANGASAVRTALVAALVSDNIARVRALAQQRVVQHVGNAVGAGLGALVLTADRPAGYLLAIVSNVLTFLVLAVLTATVPAPATLPTAAGRPRVRAVLRDLPYASVVGTTALLSLCWAMLSTGLPLWISGHTSLPLALSGAVVVISSLGIAAGQVPATRLARTPAAAARTTVWSGVVLAASCALLATTAGGGGTVAVAVVVAAALLHLAGELGYVSAAWGLSVPLMREEARGAYQGVAESATAAVQIVGPAVFTLALGTGHALGWLAVGALFLLAVAPVPALTRWAVRTRQPAETPAPAPVS
ncbi:MFS transporter [Plantactinospora sp. CA-290183]|uniref:MFS transporter n=1 Tax=Plantactinospora sp. CA-290183 TaxID=3240006 RepID=UPI003D8B0E66